MTKYLTSIIMICVPLLLFWKCCLASETGMHHRDTKIATFAGGCFWCMEADFDQLNGVVETTSGYTGGLLPSPEYKEVTAGNTGHFEAVQIFYDPEIITYEDLLHTFWRKIDPVDEHGQFCDRGNAYRTAIFTHSEDQIRIARESKANLYNLGIFTPPIATFIRPITHFYPAEEYHQDFHTKNPIRYKLYRFRCGRDARLKEIWKSESLTKDHKLK